MTTTTEAQWTTQQHPSQAELSPLLVAADEGIDPHLLVKLCCEHARSDPLTVSLVVLGDGESAATPSDAARVRLEDVIVADEGGRDVDELVRLGGFDALLVCAPHGTGLSPGLSLAARSARLHGLTILGGAHPAAGHLVHWSRPGEPAG